MNNTLEKSILLVTAIFCTAFIPVNLSGREKYWINKNSSLTPSGLDVIWSKDLTNWKNHFINRNQDIFFSSGRGYTRKRFEEECNQIKNQYQWNRCRDVEVLFLMDKLAIYFSGQKIDENYRKYVPYAAYIMGLQKVIYITDKTTKTCQNNHKNHNFDISKFKKFEEKIIYIKVTDMPDGIDPFLRE